MTTTPDNNILIIDNGGRTIKYGLSTSVTPQIIENSIFKKKGEKKWHIGRDLNNIVDRSTLTYYKAIQRGLVTNWNFLKPIWNRILANLKVEAASSTLLLTEAPLAPYPIERSTIEIIFEEYKFANLYKTTPSEMAFYKYNRSSQKKM